MSDDIDVKKAEFITECIEKGYSVTTADALYCNCKRRKDVLAQAKGRKLTKEEKQEIARTRKSDMDIIEYDWKVNQPEKYAFHYVETINKMSNKIDATENEIEKEALEKQKRDYIEKNREWVNQNKIFVIEAIKQISNPTKPSNEYSSNNSKVFNLFRGRDR
jgi:hypothetical protein